VRDKGVGQTREIELMSNCELIGHLNCGVTIRIKIHCDCGVLIERCMNIYEINILVLKPLFRKPEMSCCCLLDERYAGAHY